MKEARRLLEVEPMRTVNGRVVVKVDGKEVCWLSHEEAVELARLLVDTCKRP